MAGRQNLLIDQSRELDPNKSVFDEITGGLDELEVGKKKIASRAYVSWFNFKGAAQQRKVGKQRALHFGDLHGLAARDDKADVLAAVDDVARNAREQ